MILFFSGVILVFNQVLGSHKNTTTTTTKSPIYSCSLLTTKYRNRKISYILEIETYFTFVFFVLRGVLFCFVLNFVFFFGSSTF